MAKLKNTGIDVYGIENNEIPLVTFDITINGGHWLDPIDKSGISGLLSDLMMEGTFNRTSAELEEAIGLLGASIKISGNNEEIVLNATCLSKNFESTVKLVEEILLEPRWDELEYNRLKQALETRLKGNEANPTAIAYSNDSVAPSRVAVDFEKKYKNFKIVGGSFEGEKIDQNKINFLATLPSLDGIRGKLIRLISAPAQKIASVLQEPGAQLARLVISRSEELGKSN